MAAAPKMQQHKVQEGSDAHLWLQRIMNSSSNARQLLLQCKSVTLICSTPFVKVWLAVSANGTQYAIKWWCAERVEQSAEQCAAEARAGQLLQHLLGEPWPCICTPAAFDNHLQHGACTISVYAGQSLDNDSSCAGLTNAQLLYKGRQLAATLLMAQEVFESVPEEMGGHVVLRDLNLSNICHRTLPSGRDLFAPIDLGGATFASLSSYFGIINDCYIDPYMASPYGPEGQRAVETTEGMRAHTHPTIDKFSTGLAVMEYMFGRLPAAVDRACYGEEQLPEFLAAVHEFDWASCAQMAALPAEAQDLLCSLLARNPEERPQSAAVTGPVTIHVLDD